MDKTVKLVEFRCGLWNLERYREPKKVIACTQELGEVKSPRVETVEDLTQEEEEQTPDGYGWGV